MKKKEQKIERKEQNEMQETPSPWMGEGRGREIFLASFANRSG
jgi:hypothetical protein